MLRDLVIPDDGAPWSESEESLASDEDWVTVISEFEDQHNIEELNVQLREHVAQLTGPPDTGYISDTWNGNLTYLTVLAIASMASRAVQAVDRVVPRRDNFLGTMLGIRARFLHIERMARKGVSQDVVSIGCQAPDADHIAATTEMAFEQDENDRMTREDVSGAMMRAPHRGNDNACSNRAETPLSRRPLFVATIAGYAPRSPPSALLLHCRALMRLWRWGSVFVIKVCPLRVPGVHGNGCS